MEYCSDCNEEMINICENPDIIIYKCPKCGDQKIIEK
jgi:predicted RNA-binding Zn-ribbon protein involved in translation (DUF1610 family)